MRAGGFVFWRYEDSTSLLLDTSTMEFDILHLPFAFFQPAKYAIGEIEDGVCCLVGLVGGMYNLLLQVWLLKEKDGVAKKWMLDKSVPLSEVLGRHDRVCQVRVVNNGLALLCWDEHSTHFVIDLNTLCLKAMFVCNGIAYPVQMPWPSVVLMAAVSEFVPSKMNRATDVAACSRGRLDLVLGLDGPCDKRKTMAAEAGNAVAAPDMGQVMAVETSNMGYDLLDTQFLPESNYSDVICCLDERCGFDQNELDVAAAPSLLLCHHKKLHIESNSTSCSQQSLSSTLIEDQQQSTSQHTSDTVHSAASASGFCPLNIISSTDGPLDRDNASCTKHSSSSIRELSTAERTVTPGCTGSSIGDVNITSMQFSDQNEPYAGGDKPCSNFSVICSSRKSEESDLSINIPQDKMFDALNDKSLNIDEKDTEPVSNLVPEMNEYPIGRATPTSPKTNRQWNRFISISRTFGSDSKSLPEDLKLTGFACHSKKPQTQISYSVSHRREDLGIKHNGDYCKMQSHSSAKTNDTKRLPQNSRSGHSSSESLTCVANVLVTVGDRGWREYNTHITVDSDDQSEQRICVELAKGIKYAHKVCEALQRGVTNRYTRAMIWKGGAEWCLEFPDKGQWLIFKQMHDECYSHNIRTASVKKIPIPGVHLVEGHDDNDAVSFVRSQDHLCHIGTDVELALNESCVIYDMDSDDEEWITSQKKPLVGENTAALELTEDLFEKIMDKLERFAYSHNSSMLTIDQMKELDTGNVPLDIIKIIHTYWQDKRQKKGMPLIRHFQRW
uniref:Enhancer of polycomb-like protein n=1 Tax=Arundo donax TaxID=35708 RepID=A0A0A9CRK8_ARUDO